jgi:hypothetical protein
MTEEQAPTPSASTVTIGGTTMSVLDVQRGIVSSASWFWWVAGLSLVNSLAMMLNLKYAMILGLGVGQIIDGMFFYAGEGEVADPGMLARVFHIVLSAMVAGVFVALGYFARRFSVAAFVTGMLLYALDALLFVIVGDWIAVGFHVFVLFMLWGGLSMLRAMRAQVGSQTEARA